MIAARITRNAAKARRRPRGSDFSECRFGNVRDKLLQPLVTTNLAGLSIGLSTWRSIKSGIIEPCRRTQASGAGAWRIPSLACRPRCWCCGSGASPCDSARVLTGKAGRVCGRPAADLLRRYPAEDLSAILEPG